MKTKKIILKHACGKGGPEVPSYIPPNLVGTEKIKPTLRNFPNPKKPIPVGPEPHHRPNRDDWDKTKFTDRPLPRPTTPIYKAPRVMGQKPLEKFQNTLRPAQTPKGMIQDKLKRITEN